MSIKETNRLFPVFFKLENLKTLIVGGGYVGLEKLRAVLSNAPEALVTLVATQVSAAVRGLAASYPGVRLVERPFIPEDADSADIILIAINDPLQSSAIRDVAKSKGKLVNVADQPALCDFYLGSVVQKGNLKLAISTNGKSPTIAKRLRALLEDTLPEELDEVLEQMQSIRAGLKGDFAEKVKQLNHLTRHLAVQQEE